MKKMSKSERRIVSERMHRVLRAALYSVYVPDAGGYCDKHGHAVGRSVEDVWEELRYSVEALTGRTANDGRAGWITERPVENMIAKLGIQERAKRR